MQPFNRLIAISSLAALSGCASLIAGHTQSVTVQARHQGEIVTGAQCQISNDRGKGHIQTPGSTIVRKSAEDLIVLCEKPPLALGQATVKPSTGKWAYGSFFTSGVIGTAIDFNSGAAYDYPTVITVEMGQVITVWRSASPAGK
jgi:hypothetical protein